MVGPRVRYLRGNHEGLFSNNEISGSVLNYLAAVTPHVLFGKGPISNSNVPPPTS